jgi:hypothetical protein
MRNYIDDEPDPSKVVHSQLTLAPEEFDEFQIGVDATITFCLKEFRAILSFSEFMNTPLNVYFEGTGQPIVFNLDGDGVYRADFVMATLCEQNATLTQNTASQLGDMSVGESSALTTQKGEGSKSNRNVTTNKNSSKSHEVFHSKSKMNMPKAKEQKPNKKNTTIESTISAHNRSSSNSILDNPDLSAKLIDESITSKSMTNTREKSTKDKFLARQRNLSPQKENLQSKKAAVDSPVKKVTRERLEASNRSHADEALDMLMEPPGKTIVNDNVEDILEGTPPPAKKHRSSLFGSKVSVVNKSAIVTAENDEVLCEDTDEEDD